MARSANPIRRITAAHGSAVTRSGRQQLAARPRDRSRLTHEANRWQRKRDRSVPQRPSWQTKQDYLARKKSLLRSPAVFLGSPRSSLTKQTRSLAMQAITLHLPSHTNVAL